MDLKEKTFSISITKEDKWFVAQCLDVDVASQGLTEEKALKNVREALELHFEEPTATKTPHIRKVKVG